ncbi:hypothetical protein [Burkholderia gladioli]|uniref:hypothetical protein n=1 Tax=Burkholderia gladioli TaxID=28095 RepID=UPI00163EEB86|nr:hypothetical protein [Burkholderia gladioli]MBJ9676586.1 hypothetical protein [Burkholderia gladioli]MDN7462948.1 hypothetical protein [Burkholderia gladioli]
MTASKLTICVTSAIFTALSPIACSGAPPAGPIAVPPQRTKSPVDIDALIVGTDNKPLVVRAFESPLDQVEKAVARARDDQNARNGLLTTIFTGVSAGAALLQLALFMWQLVLMRRSVEDARASAEAANVSAKAAELNAKAAIGIELPVLRVLPPQDVLETALLIRDNEPYAGSVNDGPPTQFTAISYFTVENHGRTPAFPTTIAVGWQVAVVLPPNPAYQRTTILNHAAVINPAGQFTLDQHYGIELTELERDACTTGASWLWFYGELRYHDFLHEEHTHRFCWRHANRNPPGDNPFFFFSSDGMLPQTYIVNS